MSTRARRRMRRGGEGGGGGGGVGGGEVREKYIGGEEGRGKADGVRNESMMAGKAGGRGWQQNK